MFRTMFDDGWVFLSTFNAINVTIIASQLDKIQCYFISAKVVIKP